MKLLIAFALLIIAGCLKPDATGPIQSIDNPKIKDADLHAGATSSTNWPTDDAGGTHIGVQGRADSILVLFFKDFLDPIRLSGKVSLFLGGIVPALDSLPTRNLSFSDAETLTIAPEFFTSLTSPSQDTVPFSIRVEIDTAQCLMLGFSYSKKEGRFINSPFSAVSGSSYPMLSPRYSYRGSSDSTLFKSGTPTTGRTTFCFYIPGTPYYWEVTPNSMVEIGPLPFGAFPIRLLRIHEPDNGVSKDRLEIFQVRLDHIYLPEQRDFFTWKLGNSILSSSIEGSFSIRSKNP